MRYTIHIGSQAFTLEHDDIDKIINVDDLTKVDTSNLFGEAATVAASANRIGLLQAELQSQIDEIKLDLKIFEANFKTNIRKEASQNGGKYKIYVDKLAVEVKLTEKALETAHENNKEWVKLKKSLIKTEGNHGKISSLYWSVQEKSRVMKGIVSGTTPEDFAAGVISGKINGMLIEKK